MILSTAKQVFWAVGIIFALSCVVAVFACSTVAAWVGHTDLEVHFLVTDAISGTPVPNAMIHIRTEPGGFCAEPESPQFTIATSSNGAVAQICKQCMCFGTHGTFQDSFAMHLPRWWCHASANGYTPSKPVLLETPEYARRVKRLRPGAAITVSLQLHKAA